MTTTFVPTHDAEPGDAGPNSPKPSALATTPGGSNGTQPTVVGRRIRLVNPKKLIGHTVLIIFAMIYLYPFAIQIATSFKSDPEATAHPLSLIPNPFDLGAWKRMFGLTSDTSVPIMTWLGNSVLVTVIITTSRVFS
jgi:ABC-type glycerol-3-phosphate transport system permease component